MNKTKLIVILTIASLVLGVILVQLMRIDSSGAGLVFLVSPTPSVEKLIEMLPQFEEQTGIKVIVESVSYESMMAKETLDLRTKQGRYDIFWIEPTYLERYVLLNGLEDLKSRGVDTVELTVDNENPAACSLYESVGFEVYARTEWYEKKCALSL